MSDDGEKKSWRERDLARDRGIRFEKKTTKAQERENKVATTAAKKQLNELFSTGKLTKEKEAALNSIKADRGKPAFYEKMTAYFQQHGAPREWDALFLFLDHKDKTILLQILKELSISLPKQPLEKQSLVSTKLNSMELSTFDPDLIDAIREIKKGILKI